MIFIASEEELQWGHAFSDVEIRYRGSIPEGRALAHASMGPRLFRRGNMILICSFGESPSWLQWGHAFSDVEIENGFDGLLKLDSLQWGHAFSDVEMMHFLMDDNPSLTASMGPRLFRRGNPELELSVASEAMLQWGHAFSDVEMNSSAGTESPSWTAASMGPRLFRRGNFKRTTSNVRLSHRFNGATPFQTWKYTPRPSLFRFMNSFNGATPFQTWKYCSIFISIHNQPTASMGPRLFRRGNLPTTAETSYAEDAASMGPRLFRRGNIISKNCDTSRIVASMGPRLFRRGNAPEVAG